VHRHLADILLVEDSGRNRSHGPCRVLGLVVRREEESMTSLRNFSSDFHMSIRVGSNCGSMVAHNSARKWIREPTDAIDRTGPGRRGQLAQPADVCPPKTRQMVSRIYPTIMFSGEMRPEQSSRTTAVRHGGVWGSGVALGQQRRGGGS
jgi:hypothetical protein